jgi:hypothetical protein
VDRYDKLITWVHTKAEADLDEQRRQQRKKVRDSLAAFKSLHEQMNACSCLTLILACIVCWQSREIDRILTECDPEGSRINVLLLEHVSPIEWENIVLYGEYVLDRNVIRKTIID